MLSQVVAVGVVPLFVPLAGRVLRNTGGGRTLTTMTLTLTAAAIGWPSQAAVESYAVGRYLDVSFPNGEGSAGWVIGTRIEGDELWVDFDWGWSQRLDGDCLIAEVEPLAKPLNDA